MDRLLAESAHLCMEVFLHVGNESAYGIPKISVGHVVVDRFGLELIQRRRYEPPPGVPPHSEGSSLFESLYRLIDLSFRVLATEVNLSLGFVLLEELLHDLDLVLLGQQEIILLGLFFLGTSED